MVVNPPYGAKTQKEEQKYYKTKFSEVCSTDTVQLMIYTACKQLSKCGYHGFIVPKALILHQTGKKFRQQILCNLLTLVDCKKVWNDVKLEQIIYVYQNNCMQKSYRTGSRIEQNLVADTVVKKKSCIPFEFLISGINQNEIRLGQKIYRESKKLKKYVNNSRGCMLQNKIKKVELVKYFADHKFNDIISQMV